ncbi:NUDIX domain-containing protein, partial [Leptospira wolffii]
MDFFFKKKGLRVRVAALIRNRKGENAEDALKRELKEELSLDVTSSSFLFLNESIDPKGNRHLIQ